MAEFAMSIRFTIHRITLRGVMHGAEWLVGDHKFAVGSRQLGREFKYTPLLEEDNL
jgi:hypothetical protein